MHPFGDTTYTSVAPSYYVNSNPIGAVQGVNNVNALNTFSPSDISNLYQPYKGQQNNQSAQYYPNVYPSVSITALNGSNALVMDQQQQQQPQLNFTSNRRSAEQDVSATRPSNSVHGKAPQHYLNPSEKTQKQLAINEARITAILRKSALESSAVHTANVKPSTYVPPSTQNRAPHFASVSVANAYYSQHSPAPAPISAPTAAGVYNYVPVTPEVTNTGDIHYRPVTVGRLQYSAQPSASPADEALALVHYYTAASPGAPSPSTSSSSGGEVRRSGGKSSGHRTTTASNKRIRLQSSPHSSRQ